MKSYELANASSDSIASLSSPMDGFSSGKVSSKMKTREPKDFRFNSVNFNVKDKQILKNCWGHISPGKVCAIMGPSGED